MSIVHPQGTGLYTKPCDRVLYIAAMIECYKVAGRWARSVFLSIVQWQDSVRQPAENPDLYRSIYVLGVSD